MAAFELSLSGFPFVVPDEELLASVRKWLRVQNRMPFAVPGTQYDAAGDLQLGLARPGWPAEVDLYELYVPYSASRWSCFRGLMHAADLANLSGAGPYSLYNLNGSPSFRSATLRMSDGTGTVAPSLYLLPPQPLTGLNGIPDLYLVTLVDTRYFAHMSPVGTAANWPVNDTWTEIMATAFTAAIQTTVTASPAVPNAVYGQPEVDSDLWTFAMPAGAFCDAVLANVGMVLTSDLSVPAGYTALRWDAANTYAAAARSAANRMAGGVLWSGPTDRILAPVLPFQVVVSFPWWGEGHGYPSANATGAFVASNIPPGDSRVHRGGNEFGAVTQYVVTAASLGAPYSTLPGANPGGIGSSVYINSTAKALTLLGSPSGTPTNDAALLALAQYLAKDFYDSQLQNVCETYRGIVPFDGRSALNVVYSYWPEPMTRAWRRPINDYPSKMHHGFGEKQALETVQLVQVTGPVSGGFYPGVLASGVSGGGVAGTDVIRIKAPNAELLTSPSTFYLAKRYPTVSTTPTYFVTDPPQTLVPATTPVSGGTVGGVLYSNGSTLQSSGNFVIAGGGNTPFVQAASGKWISFAIGSN